MGKKLLVPTSRDWNFLVNLPSVTESFVLVCIHIITYIYIYIFFFFFFFQMLCYGTYNQHNMGFEKIALFFLLLVLSNWNIISSFIQLLQLHFISNPFGKVSFRKYLCLKIIIGGSFFPLVAHASIITNTIFSFPVVEIGTLLLPTFSIVYEGGVESDYRDISSIL